MEHVDRELILQVSKTDRRLRRLYDEHKNLENMLSKYENKFFLTTNEEMDKQQLKKKKLSGVDAMMQIIAPYRLM